ncbi:ParB/RepB/Spo0J family partition protein [Kordiimonas marina]|uniref:ParB/RepB/Spo0J family partition protein n=1 Tax=Kordiimonas marina TaxID=2872312 RepID=UPI001FF41FFE|nr:ParB/RepB/Spo0J family partition protein [Kordiimonas marina]MCJ9428578.1 ParB/RepB/Spo0J family partition protein [Kordiimonas marina]
MEFDFTLRGHEALDPKDIEVPTRLRAIDQFWAEALAVAISESGQLQAIEVAVNPRKKGKPFILIAGAHRLEGCKKADVTVISKIVKFNGKVADFETACRLREVDENLIRHELTPLDRAVFLAERKRIYEEAFPQVKAGVAGAAARHGDGANEIFSFAEATAQRIGIGKRTIQRACKIAESISPELRTALSKTEIAHKEGELYNLAKQGPAIQKKIVEALSQEGSQAKSVMGALKLITGSKGKAEGETAADDADFKRLMSAYRQAPAAAQKRFLSALHEQGELDEFISCQPAVDEAA